MLIFYSFLLAFYSLALNSRHRLTHLLYPLTSFLLILHPFLHLCLSRSRRKAIARSVYYLHDWLDSLGCHLL